jgi:GNAT superfamily N-acetyltransferase
MRQSDVETVHMLADAAFEDLSLRMGEPVPPRRSVTPALIRTRHLIETDPGGALLAEADGRPVGAALAIVRGALWGLSLLVVLPEHQSAGLGRALLSKALEHGAGAVRGGVILSSGDPRALRAYSRAGFTLHPAIDAVGKPRGVAAPPSVRDGSVEDLPLTEAVDQAVRGAAHGCDIVASLSAGGHLFVVPERGYAILHDGTKLSLLAALDEEAARDLLRAALAAVPPGKEAAVEFITASQPWAIEPVLDAGLELRPGGAVFLRGEVGPFAPYLPSGAYL